MHLRARFDHSTGDIVVTIVPETDPSVINDPVLGPDPVIRGLTVQIYQQPPFIRIPFSIHDGGGYHTMCRRVGDEIDRLEY